jgi:hypothetical protein
MKQVRVLSVAGAMLLMVWASACGGSAAPAAPTAAPTPIPQPTQAPTLEPTQAPEPTEAPEPTQAPEATAAAEAAPEATAEGEPAETKLEVFDATNFEKSTDITNAWMPLTPGTRYVYEGSAYRDDGVLVPHRIEIHVTDLAKEIGGVRALATWDLDYSEDVLAEAELAFYAQDKDGNVWRMGEYPEVYEDGKIVEAPTWIHGFQDALAGIMMQAEPKVGTPSYSQGWGPAVNWTDRGQVDMMGQSTCVLVDCYDEVLVIAETSLSEPDAQQLKFYARGVGNVRVGFRGAGEKTKETLELTRFERLSAEELADVRAKALALEKSAYENSQDVYANTPPAEQLPPSS